jgi:antitoxin component YwqK of YwqJK toxin-antitoxin module
MMFAKWSDTLISPPCLTQATVAVLILLTSVLTSASQQQQYKKLPGPFLIFGPVHTIRDERATFTVSNGVLAEGPRTLSMTLTYNEDGTRQERTSYEPDGSISNRTIDLYDPDGRALERKSFNGAGELTERVVTTYDSQKNLLEEITYRPNGSVSNRLTIGRRGDQRTIDSVSYGEYGLIRSKGTTTVDQRTNSSESLDYDANRVVQSQSARTENTESRTVTEQRTEGGLREIFIADQKNGEEKIRYNPDGSVRSRERRTHEFDSYGNVVKTLRSIANGNSADFKPIDVLYRTIEYYGKD